MDKLSSKAVLRYYIIYIPLICTVFFLITFCSLFFNSFMEVGTGVVKATSNRGGHVKDAEGNTLKSGLFAQLDDGTEIDIQGIWDVVKNGDYIEKSKWSFIYKVNGKKINVFSSLLISNLKGTGIAFIVFSVFCLSVYVVKRYKGM